MELTLELARHILACHANLDGDTFGELADNDPQKQYLSEERLDQVQEQLETAFPVLRNERREEDFARFCHQVAVSDPRIVEKQQAYYLITKQPVESKPAYWERTEAARKALNETFAVVLAEVKANPQTREKYLH